MTTNETGAKPNTSLPPAQPSFLQYIWPAYKRVLERTKKPILVGPWRGEVGFEALYWLPWLSALRKTVKAPMIPITRGGMGALYGCEQYVELYAMRTPDEMRVENRVQQKQYAMLKQMRTSEWDAQVIRDAAETLKLTQYHVLHPKWMFQTLAPFWDGHRGVEWLRPQLDFPIPPVPTGEVTLPDKFVAVRFYARATFPASPMTADIARETIKHLAKDQPVILLNAGVHADDHLDFGLKTTIPNVMTLSDVAPVCPENNLGLQALVLSKALGFVGTYGGLAQLALRLKKPSVSLYTEWGGTMWAHRTLSEQLAASMGVPFHVQRVADLPLLQTVLPRFVLQK